MKIEAFNRAQEILSEIEVAKARVEALKTAVSIIDLEGNYHSSRTAAQDYLRDLILNNKMKVAALKEEFDSL